MWSAPAPAMIWGALVPVGPCMQPMARSSYPPCEDCDPVAFKPIVFCLFWPQLSFCESYFQSTEATLACDEAERSMPTNSAVREMLPPNRLIWATKYSRSRLARFRREGSSAFAGGPFGVRGTKRAISEGIYPRGAASGSPAAGSSTAPRCCAIALYCRANRAIAEPLCVVGDQPPRQPVVADGCSAA